MTFLKTKMPSSLRTASGVLALALACTSLFSGKVAHGTPGDKVSGTQKIYGDISPDQIEFLSTGDRIKSVASSGSMTAIWETLEHGEKVECLDCIPSIEPLIYDANPRTREIAAWWLRRRIFGVFGPGQVYERTLTTMQSDPDPKRRAQAAEAAGEFLAAPGAAACAAVIERDGDPTVRAAAVTALGRLNSDGKGALSKALGDADARVRIAALGTASKVNGFADVVSVARLVGDPDAKVRRRATELLGSLRVVDAVDGVIAVAKTDGDASVRNAACHALGEIRDGRARAALEEIAQRDTDGLVRDQAKIALRRL